MNIETELLKATKANKGKDRQETLRNICRSALKLSEEDWDRLSPEAQEWANVAGDAIREKKALTDFFKQPQEKDVAKTKAGNGKEAPPKKTLKPAPVKVGPKIVHPDQARRDLGLKKPAAKATKPVAKPAPAAKAKPKPGARPHPGGPSVPTLVIRAVIKDPHIAFDELRERMKAKGKDPSPSTVSSLRGHVREVLRELAGQSLLVKEMASRMQPPKD